MTDEHDIAKIARQFAVDGEFLEAIPYGGGHINETYCVTFSAAGTLGQAIPKRIILQRINDRVFRNPLALMENIERVTRHLAMRLADEPDKERRALSLIPDRKGHSLHVDTRGGNWRAYQFIEGARTYDTVASAQQAWQGARAFGRFLELLADLPAPRLHDTIPDFHHAPKRFCALEEAMNRDAAGRVRAADPEIAFAFARKSLTRAILDAGLPERVTHNDTKINNVLFDDATGEAICAIDLETVMPGFAAYDFGDLVRSATCAAPEDERDLNKVAMRFDLFEALARGYLSSAGSLLTRAEKESLVAGGKLITFVMGIRFLTDYLNGDTYYKVHRAGHNLDRCRVQFKLLESIEAQERAMERLVSEIG
ncbi:MAG TPA: aminoglycoside phosphotransferase family protein [Terracidiphilus sp.]|nr:aminoglycoside phosphotransferase family protein [Terracidiphilus sp.]